jgi:hypothetical protein
MPGNPVVPRLAEFLNVCPDWFSYEERIAFQAASGYTL